MMRIATEDGYESADRAARRPPTVSVIIPAYNAATYIAEALASVFAQTFKDFEVIVINDGSPDTPELEGAIEPYRDHVLYLKQENRGPSAARNLGIRHARGEFVAFLDSDDAWFSEYLAAQMKLFEETPSLDLVYSDVLWHSDSTPTATYMAMCPSKGPVTFESLLTEECAIPTSNAVARRQVILDAGLFDEGLTRAEDYDLWLRVAYRGGKIAYQEKVLGRHRGRPESLSGDKAQMIESLIQVLTKLKTLRLPEGKRALLQRRLGWAKAQLDVEQGRQYLLGGRFSQAAASFKRAYTFFHSPKLRILLLGLKITPRLTAVGARTWTWLLLAAKRRRLLRSNAH